MSPLGIWVDDSSRKPHGAERPELKWLHRGTPTDPQFPEAHRSEGKKKPLSVLLQTSKVLFTVLSLPALLPFSSSLFPLTTTLRRPSLICFAQRPGDEKADRCLVTS